MLIVMQLPEERVGIGRYIGFVIVKRNKRQKQTTSTRVRRKGRRNLSLVIKGSISTKRNKRALIINQQTNK